MWGAVQVPVTTALIPSPSTEEAPRTQLLQEPCLAHSLAPLPGHLTARDSVSSPGAAVPEPPGHGDLGCGRAGSWVLPGMRLGPCSYTPRPTHTQRLGQDLCVEQKTFPSVLVFVCQPVLCLVHRQAQGLAPQCEVSAL